MFRDRADSILSPLLVAILWDNTLWNAASSKTGGWNEVFLKEFRRASLTEKEENHPSAFQRKRWPHAKQHEGKVILMRLYKRYVTSNHTLWWNKVISQPQSECRKQTGIVPPYMMHALIAFEKRRGLSGFTYLFMRTHFSLWHAVLWHAPFGCW